MTGLVAPLDEEKRHDRCSREPTTKHPDPRIPTWMFLAGISVRKNGMTPAMLEFPPLFYKATPLGHIPDRNRIWLIEHEMISIILNRKVRTGVT